MADRGWAAVRKPLHTRQGLTTKETGSAWAEPDLCGGGGRADHPKRDPSRDVPCGTPNSPESWSRRLTSQSLGDAPLVGFDENRPPVPHAGQFCH